MQTKTVFHILEKICASERNTNGMHLYSNSHNTFQKFMSKKENRVLTLIYYFVIVYPQKSLYKPLKFVDMT